MKERMDCGLLIKQIHDSMEKQANNYLRQQDLTRTQVSVLLELLRASGKQMPLKDLERYLHVAQSTAAGIVSRLEQKGFVKGFGSPEDRRIKIVRITPAGEEYCRHADEVLDSAEENLLSGFSEEERKTFFSLLQRAADNTN